MMRLRFLGIAIVVTLCSLQGCNSDNKQTEGSAPAASNGSATQSAAIPADWNEWAKLIETKLPADAQGHGPDIGSDEWASMVDKKLAISADGHGPDLKSAEWRSAVEKKVGLSK